jgi:hypothetical protein
MVISQPESMVAVQALDAKGNVLATSKPVSTGQTSASIRR